MTKLLEGHNVKINSVITKYKHTHTAFVKSFQQGISRELLRCDRYAKSSKEKIVKTG